MYPNLLPIFKFTNIFFHSVEKFFTFFLSFFLFFSSCTATLVGSYFPDQDWTPGHGGILTPRPLGKLLLFTSLWCLLEHKCFNFDEVQFICFFLWLLVPLDSYLRNYCLIQSYENLHLYFKSFRGFTLTLGFWFILS